MMTTARHEYGFPTQPVDRLDLAFEGIPGDRHFGWTRPADSRLPMYPRGTPVRNVRSLSLVSTEDLAAIADRLGSPVDPRWIGANIVVSGIAGFTFLPRGTRLRIDGGATLIVEDLNKPCRFAGKIIADNTPGRADIELAFAKVATGLRGIVASVERPGAVVAGAQIEAQIPEQWLYA